MAKDVTIEQVKKSIPDSMTADGKTLIQLVCQSEMCLAHVSTAVLSKWLSDTTLDLEEIIAMPQWKTADDDTLLQLICQLKACFSRISSIVILKWLSTTTLDLPTLDFKTTDTKILFQQVCQSKTYVSRIPSAIMSKWLSDTTLHLHTIVDPNWKTADDEALLQLVCQSETTMSQISSAVLSRWLKDHFRLANVIMPGWTTADGDTVLQLVCQSKICLSQISSAMLLMWLRLTILYHVNISLPDSKTADGDPLVQLVCQSEATVSRISSAVLSKWLRDTTHYIRLANIIVPDWKTADGDTLLQLVCESETCLSRISSAVLLMWLRIITLDHVNISLPDSKTSNGDTLLQLAYQLPTTISRISSAVLLKWLRDTTLCIDYLANIVKPEWKTADDNTLLQLVCQSETTASRISSPVLSKWLRYTSLNLAKMIIPQRKTADGDTLLQLVCESETCLSRISSVTLLKWLHITALYHVNISLPDSKTADGDTLLHLILQSAMYISRTSSTVLSKWLSTSSEVTIDRMKMINPNWKTLDGDCFFHALCQSKIEDKQLIELIQYYMRKDGLNPDILDSKKNTALHIACRADKPALVSFLLNEAQCDPSIRNKKEKLPLDMTTNPEVINYLCQHDQVSVFSNTVTRWMNNKAIDNTKMMGILKLLVDNNYGNNTIDGSTLLHLTCKPCSGNSKFRDKIRLIHYLFTEGHSDPNCLDSKGRMPLQLTSDSTIMKKLIEHGAKMTADVVFKMISSEHITGSTAIELFTLSTRKGTMLWNPNDLNIDGYSALHLACKAGSPTKVNLVLSVAHCDPNIKNNNEEVPLQMTTNPEIIKDLIRHGAKTSIMYESCQNTLGTNGPVKPPVKVFIVGNPYVGKSSLTTTLKKKLNIVARFFTSGKVSGVDQKTVGIVPHEVESDIYGQITLYDFAGHREFYSGHAALLQTAIQSTPPVFLLVINLYQDDDAITKDIMYWISFLENQCASVNCKPHIILVGSHADSLQSSGINAKNKIKAIIDSLDTTSFSNMELVGFVAMDCRYHESSGMSDLRRLLIKSCNELRINEPITFNAHCFLVYLIDTFKNSSAVTINTIHGNIENQLKSQTKERVLEFLPQSFEALYKVCIELNDRGHILLLKDRINAENSYIVIDKTFLLSEISGTVFAPEGFRQHTQLSTNTGVVPRSKLADSFPGKDINIVIGFFNHLEFCHEIDQALHRLISEQYSQTYDDNEHYYLFPALISVNAKDSLWKTESHFDHNFGWTIQCINDEQFFSSRFLQVLLLRLAFSFALKVSSNDHKFGIHRKCSIWKNGIFWGRNFNMDVLVEVNDSKSVIVMARFDHGTSNLLKCIKHRSEIIQTVLECIKQFCPRIKTTESFIDSSSALQYPFALNLDKTHCIVKDICEALASNCECPSVVLSDSGKSMSAEKFLSFEPYSEIALSTLYELWDKEAENNVVSEDFTVRFFRHASSKLAEWFVRIFIESADIPSSRDDLIHELIKWRDNDTTEQKTYKDLRQRLDQYSVFAGRSILVNSKMKATLSNY